MAATPWSIAQIWNQSFENIPPETIKKRKYLYASELGGSPIEIYYKLKGTPYTNTFTAANRRKMEAGKLFESIVRYVLKRAGILHASQQEANHQIPGCLEVHGRLDFIAGGKVDIVQAEQSSSEMRAYFAGLDFPEIYLQIADRVFEMVKEIAARKQTLQMYVLEIKSVSDFVYRLLERATRAQNFHHLQGAHYLTALDMKMGKVCYINRDDVRIMEKNILNNGETLKEYADWIQTMSDYVLTGTVPPKEPEILFYRDSCSFSKNTVGVEWCKYLTMLYGYESPEQFRDHIEPIVTSHNYVYQRCVTCAKLTDDNVKKIAEYRKKFPDWDNLVDIGKLRRAKMQAAKGAAA